MFRGQVTPGLWGLRGGYILGVKWVCFSTYALLTVHYCCYIFALLGISQYLWYSHVFDVNWSWSSSAKEPSKANSKCYNSTLPVFIWGNMEHLCCRWLCGIFHNAQKRHWNYQSWLLSSLDRQISCPLQAILRFIGAFIQSLNLSWFNTRY